MSNIVPPKQVESIPTSEQLPTFDPSDSIFRKLENHSTFSPEDVGKIITAISKKEANKKLIETFTSNLKVMADEAKEKDEAKRMEIPPQAQTRPGKNAYEIRSDILQMAIDWATVKDQNQVWRKPSEDELLNLAKKFYSFVENRR